MSLLKFIDEELSARQSIFLLPNEQMEIFKGVAYIRETKIFYDVTNDREMSAAEFDALHARWKGFWAHEGNRDGRVKRASVAFLRSTLVAFPQVDRLIITELLAHGTMGTDAFGYTYITKFGKK